MHARDWTERWREGFVSKSMTGTHCGSLRDSLKKAINGHNRVNPGLFLAPCGLGGLHIVSSVGHPVCHIKKTIT